jgi:hypothetical protein
MIERALAHVPARGLADIETCVHVDAETRRAVAGWLPAGLPSAPRTTGRNAT